MKLKTLKGKKNIKFSEIFFKFYFFFTISLLFLVAILFLNTGIWKNFKGKYEDRIYLNGTYNYKFYPKIIIYKLNNLFIKHKKIYIDINQKNILKLEKNRKEILIHINEEPKKAFKHLFPYVEADADITFNNKTYKSKIRLKGDRSIHFRNKETSSYKFELKNNYTVNTANNFSLQKPRIRNYLHEWVFHELLKLGSLITIKYDFFEVYINGKYQGYYAFEENFGKILIEKNRRRYGPIFSLYENFETNNDKKIKFEVYDKKYWNKSENINLLRAANSKLIKFINNEANLNEVFDLEKWAWFFAVTDLGYTYHGSLTKSVKFYYNPVIGKFEPIGYDGHRLVPNFYNLSQTKYFPILNNIIFKNNDKYHSFSPSVENAFFYTKDNTINYEFYDLYLNAITKITSKKFLNNFFIERKKFINDYSSGIYSDHYVYDYNSERRSGIGIYFFSKEEYLRRASQIRQILKPNILKIFVTEKKDYFEIENNYFYNYNFEQIIFNCETKKIKINSKLKNKIIVNKDERFKDSNCNEVIFIDKFDKVSYVTNINKHNLDIKTNFNDHDKKFLKFFKQKKNFIDLKEDFTIIDENIIIPEGNILKIFSGQKIVLINNSYLVSKSPVIIGGSGKRTVITGNDDNFGGGLIVETTNKKSSIINTDIKNLNGTALNKVFDDKIIYGAINFINSKVNIDDVMFKNIKSEDALNIISSEFSIKNTKFKNISSDAIDIDFGNGTMQNLFFENIKNDAIDFSASNANIEELYFKTIGDKLVSAGEESNINLKKIDASHSNVGLASKDKSILIAKDIKFKNINYPFTAYMKKNEYGGSNLYLSNINNKNSIASFVFDKNSSIFDLDNKKIKFKNSPNYKKIITAISQ
jgi:hypothetical protein